MADDMMTPSFRERISFGTNEFGDRPPRVYYDPRSIGFSGRSGQLHGVARCSGPRPAREALVTSSGLHGSRINHRNGELGLIVPSGYPWPSTVDLKSHFMKLIQQGDLERVPAFLEPRRTAETGRSTACVIVRQALHLTLLDCLCFIVSPGWLGLTELAIQARLRSMMRLISIEPGPGVRPSPCRARWPATTKIAERSRSISARSYSATGPTVRGPGWRPTMTSRLREAGRIVPVARHSMAVAIGRTSP